MYFMDTYLQYDSNLCVTCLKLQHAVVKYTRLVEAKVLEESVGYDIIKKSAQLKLSVLTESIYG